jgi:hypothetical protein
LYEIQGELNREQDMEAKLTAKSTREKKNKTVQTGNKGVPTVSRTMVIVQEAPYMSCPNTSGHILSPLAM